MSLEQSIGRFLTCIAVLSTLIIAIYPYNANMLFIKPPRGKTAVCDQLLKISRDLGYGARWVDCTRPVFAVFAEDLDPDSYEEKLRASTESGLSSPFCP